jgi:hypothetical protein
MKKRFVFVTLLIAIVALTQIPVSLVRAEDSRLPVLSGSDCDPTTFEYEGHTIAEGFAVSTSADFPFDTITNIKFGGAVAGLGDSWVESALPYIYFEHTPYVKEMWLRVEGVPPYTALEDTIYDNTGTGGASMETFLAILNGIGIIFTAYEIYQWLSEVYQLPPVAEWDFDGHWSEAIVRQKTEAGFPIPYVNPDNPRLQTASANVWGYFYEGSSKSLNVTAQAEIYLQTWDVLNSILYDQYIGTYSVSFEVEVVRHDVAVNSVSASPASVRVGDPVTITADVQNQGGPFTETFGVTAYYGGTAIGTQTVTNLAAGSNRTLTFTWDTAGVADGNYQIKAVANTVTGETDTADNTYVDGTVEVYWVHDVAVTSASYELPYGATAAYPTGWEVSITVTVENEGDYAENFNVTAYANTTIIDTKTVTLGAGASTYIYQKNLAKGETKNYNIAKTWTFPAEPKVQYQLREVMFQLKCYTTGQPTAYGKVETQKGTEGWVQFGAEQSTTETTWQDKTVTGDVLSNENEQFQVRVSLGGQNDDPFSTAAVLMRAVRINQTTTLTFNWTVSTLDGWTPYPPHYAISAEAETVPGETDTSDNTFIDGSVTVKHAGDVDGDGDVDWFDLGLFSVAYGSQYGDPNYDWRCDFDGDGDVDWFDFSTLSANYGHQP